MILDPSGTTTFPNFTDPSESYTLDDAFWEAQYTGWSTFFGDLLAWAFFACLTIQVYFYFINFPQDRRLIKMTVLTLFLFEIADTAFLTWCGYVTHIKQWGHSVSFMPGIWGAMLFDCTIASIVHILYSWRIFKLITRQWLAYSLALLIMLLSMAQLACCVTACMYMALQMKLSPDVQFIARKFFHAWLILATTADVVITVIMAFKLFSARTGVRSTDKAITKLLYVTIPGGAITAVVTLTILMLQITFPNSMHYQLLVICLTKFYSNSVVVCLNLRASNVNGAGRHTMLTGFQTTGQVSSSRLPFGGIKVDCKVEKFTSSSGNMASNAFHSDPVSNNSDYGMMEEGHHTSGSVHEDHRYPYRVSTKPLNINGYPSSSLQEKPSFTDFAIPSIHSASSTKASGGHKGEGEETNSYSNMI